MERTRDAGAWVVPTMALWETLMGTSDLETLTSLPELRYMPPQLVEQWTSQYEARLSGPNFDSAAARHIVDNRKRVLAALNNGDVPILMGTDAPSSSACPVFRFIGSSR